MQELMVKPIHLVFLNRKTTETVQCICSVWTLPNEKPQGLETSFNLSTVHLQLCVREMLQKTRA